jgi:hypothetical protein
MATKIAFQLIPLDIHSLQPFDLSQLPFSILANVEVADVSELLPPSMFEHMKVEIGRQQMHFLDSTVKHALVHRYCDPPEATTYEVSTKLAKRNDELLNEVFGCSRIVRPTRRLASMTGIFTANGTVDQQSVTLPNTAIDVPEGLKLFTFRNNDLTTLRALVCPFLTAMHGECWSYRMAVQYYYMGFETNDWKGRYLCWGSSALHALYSPNSDKLVRRVKHFLGEKTPIYPPDEHPEFEFEEPDPRTIGDVIEDINDVRNRIAHGERIPDKFFGVNAGRVTLGRRLNYISVLDDALAFIVRATLRRILTDNLLGAFTSRKTVSAFWKSRGL